MSNLIRRFLDIFYPLVSKIFDKTTYYYAACGVGNLVLSWILFFLFYQFVFEKKLLYVKQIDFVFTPYTLSAFLCFIISFTLGFMLMKYVVFTKSELKGRIQLFRYGLSAVVTSGANWILLKSLIELFEFFPSVANVVSTCLVVVISYLIQRNFTFK
ncbi:MAG: GtrA family protein [Crocinitomicaceae bacterium]|jgi:putative flippase GtrA|tara:strand:+ start:2502 stop:2972 length:471 start_codon:yes stop_codon:yes gene_type:complete